MVEGFEGLSEQEFEALKNGISWITVLIAGADGVIDSEEQEWAEKVTMIRAYSLPNELKNFYAEVGEDFAEKLDETINEVNGDISEIQASLSSKLASLNPILAKLENDIAVDLYESYLSFAVHVAKSSGGFLGMMSISAEEKELIGLTMLNKIERIQQ